MLGTRKFQGYVWGWGRGSGGGGDDGNVGWGSIGVVSSRSVVVVSGRLPGICSVWPIHIFGAATCHVALLTAPEASPLLSVLYTFFVSEFLEGDGRAIDLHWNYFRCSSWSTWCCFDAARFETDRSHVIVDYDGSC